MAGGRPNTFTASIDSNVDDGNKFESIALSFFGWPSDSKVKRKRGRLAAKKAK